MNDIANIDRYGAAQPVDCATKATRGGAEPGSPDRPSELLDDKVELSELGRLLAAARDLPDIRMDKVIAVRKQIEQGNYETSDKIALTVERLLRDLA